MPYTSKYQKQVVFSYGYKLGCVDNKLSTHFKSYLGKDAAYNFNSTVIEESKYSNDVMEKHFNKELLVNKKDNEGFNN